MDRRPIRAFSFIRHGGIAFVIECNGAAPARIHRRQ